MLHEDYITIYTIALLINIVALHKGKVLETYIIRILEILRHKFWSPVLRKTNSSIAYFIFQPV